MNGAHRSCLSSRLEPLKWLAITVFISYQYSGIKIYRRYNLAH